ncbi:MAG TPA: response regulator transcription factor [Vicinamibacterales bacterium]|jgi:DNA-binding response OmpR family regulator
MTRKQVLVVEDEPHIRDLVCLHLGLEGYECVSIGDGREALKVLTDRPFDLVVLDVMLPGVDGVTICRAVRRQGVNRDVPILVLTARREESDKVLGLDSGADDYLTKPFGMRELVARVGALTRRARASMTDEAHPADQALQIHGLEIDPARRALTVRGEPVEVTRQEFHLLHLLASNPGIVFTRERLLSKVWQGQAFVTGRSVDTLVKRLRRKIEIDPASPRLIITVWGDGYKFLDG